MVVAAILVELVAFLFLSAHFRRRCRWTTRDTAVAVLVPGAWIVALYVSKLIIWRYTQGRAVWFTYGSDKGLSNVVIESAIVTLLVAFYLVARATAMWSSRSFAIMRVMLVGLAVFVALLVPPLGE